MRSVIPGKHFLDVLQRFLRRDAAQNHHRQSESIGIGTQREMQPLELQLNPDCRSALEEDPHSDKYYRGNLY